MSALLGTSLSGLMAAQRSLEMVNHNISNANTDGYSRQRAELNANAPIFTNAGWVGQGVKAANVTRSYDQFINKQLITSTSAFGDINNYQQLAAKVDNIVGNSDTGLTGSIGRFFNSVQEVANDPSSITARQVMLTSASSLPEAFNSIASRFIDLRDQNNSEIDSTVNDINSLASSIANINKQIVSDANRTQGYSKPNDLMDQQDALILKLAAIVKVSVLPQQDGSSSVFIGNGQVLVLSSGSVALTTSPSVSDPSRSEIGIASANGFREVTGQVTGGSLGGLLRFRDEVLDPAQQKVGRVAAGLAMEFNALHKKGFDLNGVAGTDMFKFSGVPIPVSNNPLNTGTVVVNASFQDVNANPSAAGNLDYSDFKLNWVGLGGGVDYTLTRLRDNQVINLTSTDTAPPTNFFTLSFAATQPANTDVKGMPGIDITLDLTGGKTFANADEFLIKPTYTAAQKFAVNISDPKKIAAATNIEVDPITNLPVPKLDAFNNPVLDALGNPVYVTINGPMPGDNRNALLLANLAEKTGMIGGTATLSQSYIQMVSGVGVLTQAAQIGSNAQEALLTQAKGDRESLAGVNLDEEAANLIRFQQAYQASAQSITVARSLFDTLLGAVR